jgi:regulator of nucleoside diphosphate kinase
MRKKNIYITQLDNERLEKMISNAKRDNAKDKEYLAKLEAELNRAKVVAPENIPHNIVTMNSQIRLRDIVSDEEMTIELVFPERKDFLSNRISVLAPIGTAILGYKVGDEIEWEVPAGEKTFRIEEILFQPEASGQFEL